MCIEKAAEDRKIKVPVPGKRARVALAVIAAVIALRFVLRFLDAVMY